MGILDLGGGLAVDYDGSHTNFASSSNYSLGEYCCDIIEVVCSVLDESGVPHPVLVTESGRATVAYASALVFNVLDVSRFEPRSVPDDVPDDAPETSQGVLLFEHPPSLPPLNYSPKILDCFVEIHHGLRSLILADPLRDPTCGRTRPRMCLLVMHIRLG